MPLNIATKVFTRRKSSGNILDDVQAPRPVSDGFRVMSQFEVQEKKNQQAAEKERKDVRPVNRKSATKAKPPKYSFEDDQAARDSGIYDNSSSSARYSSTSTLPSSTDKEPLDIATHHKDASIWSKAQKAGRTFTIGSRNKPDIPPPSDLPALPLSASPMSLGLRERPNTTSDFLNTPSKNENRLTLGDSDFGGGFDNLFEGMQKPKPSPRESMLFEKPLPPGPVLLNRTESEPALAVPLRAFASNRLHSTPDPITIHSTKEKDVTSPPYSWGSRTSQDGLMSSPVLNNHSPLFDRPPAVPPHRTVPSPGQPRPPPEVASPYLKRSDSPYNAAPYNSSSANLLSLPPSNSPGPRGGQSSSDISPKHSVSSFSTSSIQAEHTLTHPPQRLAPSESEGSIIASEATPRNRKGKDAIDVDIELAASAKAAMTLAERPPANRVMNQEQFKNYQKQQELDGTKEGNDSDSDSDSYDYDEDDEAQRQHDLAKQRRKQEATMSVYRQQMSKMTGEKPMSGPVTSAERPGALRTTGISRTSIGTDYSNSPASLKDSGATEDGDSPDEDTPLGILMAHGFPAKNRPPSKMMGLGMTDRPSSESHLSAPSVAAGGSGHLPAFARGLPREVPNFLGDGLHASGQREPLMFGNAGAGSVYGGGSVAGDVPRNQTLVNVIANEERNKAMRRGSPNARNGFGPLMNHGNHSMPNFQQSPNAAASMGIMDPSAMGSLPMMGMGMMNMPTSPMSPMDPMTQMMMNQQMLQQQLLQSQQAMAAMLQSMNGMTGPVPAPMVGPQPGYLAPGGFTPDRRPMSIAQGSQRASSMVRPPSTFGLGPPQPRANTMVRPSSSYNTNSAGRQSMLSLGGGLGPPQGYTPSIAPSERSNVGMASRYRAVNTAAPDGGSVVSNTTLQPTIKPMQGGSPLVDTVDTKAKPGRGKVFLSAFKRDKKQEEDDDDWSDVAARRKRAPSTNRQQQQTNDLKELWPQTA